MTQTGYFPAPTTAPTRPVWRTALTVVLAIFSIPTALMLAFAGLITWTGCFIECRSDDPNHPLGALLYLGAIAALSSGPLLAHVVMRSKPAVIATLVLPVVVVGYVLLCFV